MERFDGVFADATTVRARRPLRRGSRLATVVLVLAALTGPLAGPSSGQELDLHGHLRHRYERLTDFPVGAEGTGHGQPARSTMRLFAGANLDFGGSLRVRTQIQVVDGQVLGPESPVGIGLDRSPWRNTSLVDQLRIRETSVQIPLGLGHVRIGRMPMHRGLGLAIHDGERRSSPFDEPVDGELVNGIQLQARPLLPFDQGRFGHALHMGLEVHLVERSELVRRTDGDRAPRVVTSVSWREPSLEAELAFIFDKIDRSDGSSVRRILLDATTSWKRTFRERLDMHLEGELAVRTGSSATALDDDGERRSLDARQVAAAAVLELTDAPSDLGGRLELGYASGDDDPTDGVDRAFRMDPGHRAGMLLFSNVLARAGARSLDRIRSGEGSSVEPNRPDVGAIRGGISNALYATPSIRYEPIDGVVLPELGALAAWAPQPVVDPSRLGPSRLGPSRLGDEREARSPWGGEARRGWLAWELHSGARVDVDLAEVAELSLGAQYGLLLPGDALAEGSIPGGGLGEIHELRILADVRW